MPMPSQYPPSSAPSPSENGDSVSSRSSSNRVLSLFHLTRHKSSSSQSQLRHQNTDSPTISIKSHSDLLPQNSYSSSQIGDREQSIDPLESAESSTHRDSASSNSNIVNPEDIFEPPSSSIPIPTPALESASQRQHDNSLHSRSSSSKLLVSKGLCNSAQRRSSSLMFQAPHLITEDFTSPVLDSTVELITNQNLNDVDVVQLSHSNPQSTLLRSVKHRASSAGSCTSNNTLSAGYSPISRRQSDIQFNFCVKSPPRSPLRCSPPPTNPMNFGSSRSSLSGDSLLGHNSHSGEPGRKSISFYSYSDLVNYERSARLSRDLIMSPSTAASVSLDTESPDIAPLSLSDMIDDHINPSQPPPIQEKPQLLRSQLQMTERDGAVNSGLTSPPSTTDDNCDLFSLTSHSGKENVNSVSSTGNMEESESVRAWSPFTDYKARSMSDSARMDGPAGAKLNSCIIRGGPSFTTAEASNTMTPAPNYIADSVNVCSAKDFLKSKSRQLCGRANTTTHSGSPSVTIGADSDSTE
ncbi:hypothetical protein FOA43_001113 [Brettanomyces nanus]|uniref:Uncharacterized protein n=1 Tax=Eeniella nana TaxID=13502 RepID=A0A875S1T2_EENNA|nr:uncharacterized protein FOA43_001113 [Brettanomyces nanus]QPG73799.1 hypothetical protein FOA43_001113 [Brettanomyces nanus]